MHPEVATRDCTDCQKHLYDEKTGRPVLRRNKPVNRPDKAPPPCRTSKGCPKGTPEDSHELTPLNWQAYTHYQECKAVGCFPDDPLVRFNAALISKVEERRKDLRHDELIEYLKIVATIP